MGAGRVLIGTLLIGTVLLVVTGTAGLDLTPTPQQDDALTVERTEFVVTVDANGTATWTITYQFELTDADTEAAFDALAADIEANSSRYTDHLEAEFAPLVATAEADTDRTMTLRNRSVETASPDAETGVLTYRFEWTNFAAVAGPDIRIGDAIAGVDLPAGAELTITWPESHRLDAVTPAPTVEGPTAVAWEHTDATFGPEEPQITVTSQVDSPVAGLGWPHLIGAAVVIALVFLLAIHGTLAIAGLLLAKAAPEGGAAEPPGTTGSDDQPSTVASGPEAQVEQVLVANDGRLTNAQLAAALEWPQAEVDAVTEEMAAAGTVKRADLGDTTLVVLPDDTAD